MNLIALDAATEACSVALKTSDKIISRFDMAPQSHSLLLLPMVDEVLNEADLKLKQLDGLVYGRGPGSFTGVRIGIGVAQGLAFSCDLPVVGISSLQAMAQQAHDIHGATRVVAAIDARMSEIYQCVYQANEQGLMEPLYDEQVMAPNLLKSFIEENISSERNFFDGNVTVYGVGSGWKAYAEQLNTLQVRVCSDVEFPDAAAMLKLAEVEFERGNTQTAEQAQPKYVRDTVSWKKLPGRE